MNRYKSFNYFLRAVNHPLRFSSGSQFLVLSSQVNKVSVQLCSNKVSLSTETEPYLKPVEKIDLSDYGSALPTRFNFAMIADKSPLVQKLIDLGVDLHKVERKPKAAKCLLSLSLEKLKMYLDFLKQNGVSADKIGATITKNPLIFKEDLDDLDVRINYLKSKKFDPEMISTIIIRNPNWLSISVKNLDERLGFLQQTFHLKGDQIRKMITEEPSLALIKKERIMINTYRLKEEMGLNVHILKKVIVQEPSLLKINSYNLVSTYEYLTKTMKVSLHLIITQPYALTYRKFIFQERHKFLESLGRAQYCQFLPGYVSLLDLVKTTDKEFCEKIAKTSEKLYIDFLKTL